MLKKLYEKNFEKWENKKRAKLGNEKFLTKYTRSFPKQIKLLKILTLVAMVLFIVGIVEWLIIYIINPNSYNLGFMLSTFFIAALFTLGYFIAIRPQIRLWPAKVKQWNEELAEMNKEIVNN